MVKIVQKGNKVLDSVAKEVPLSEITSPKIQKILKDMKEAMHREDDSVAIAAPQIEVPLRIFVVSGIFYEGTYENEDVSLEDMDRPDDAVFINPKIIKQSKKTDWSEEGCLSVRPWYGEVKRYTNTTVEAYDEHGKKFTRGAGGLLSQIFQHEIDHLDGILFDSKAKNLREVDLEKYDEGK